MAIIFNCYRLAFAVALGFFVFHWEDHVGKGWTFGMAAFFDVFAAALVVVVVWKGKWLRRFTPKSLFNTEEGKSLTVADGDSEFGSKATKSCVEVKE